MLIKIISDATHFTYINANNDALRVRTMEHILNNPYIQSLYFLYSPNLLYTCPEICQVSFQIRIALKAFSALCSDFLWFRKHKGTTALRKRVRYLIPLRNHLKMISQPSVLA